MRIVPRLRREAGSEADSDRNGDRDCNRNRHRNGDRNCYRYDDRNCDGYCNTGRLWFDNRKYDWATIGPRHDRALWNV